MHVLTTVANGPHFQRNLSRSVDRSGRERLRGALLSRSASTGRGGRGVIPPAIQIEFESGMRNNTPAWLTARHVARSDQLPPEHERSGGHLAPPVGPEGGVFASLPPKGVQPASVQSPFSQLGLSAEYDLMDVRVQPMLRFERVAA